MASYSADNPSPYGRQFRKPDGSVWIQPQVATGQDAYQNPTGFRDDASSAPYQIAGPSAGKPKDLSSSRLEKLSDGWHVVSTDANGQVTVDPTVVSPNATKTLTPGQKLRNAPDGLHAVNDDGTLGALVVAKPPPASAATAAGTNARNTAQAGYDQARIDAMKKAAWSSVQPELDAIDQQFQAGTLTADQRDTAKAGVIDQAIKSTTTGMTAAQRATTDYQQGVLANDAAKTAADAQGQAISEGNNRATTAASIWNAANTAANDAAQHGSPFAHAAMRAQLGADTPQAFMASMGGGPLLTQDQKVQIGQALLAGATKQQVLPQIAAAHNGNLAVLAGGGPQFTAPATGADGSQIPPGYGTGPGQVMPEIVSQPAPQFTAPDVANNPTLAAAGSGGL